MLSVEQAASVLGIRWPCTADQLKKAYWLKSKETHPDRGGSAGAFKMVSEAKNRLEKEINDSSSTGTSTHSSRSYDPYDPRWHRGFYDAEEEEVEEEVEEEEVLVGEWYTVLSVSVDGVRIDQNTHCRAQLAIIGGNYFIAVYFRVPQPINSDHISVVLSQDGDPTPSLFVRKIAQRSYYVNGLVSALWFSPIRDLE